MFSPVGSKFRFTVWNVGRESHEASRSGGVLGVAHGGGEFGETSAVQGVVFVVTGAPGGGGGGGGRHAHRVETLAAWKYNAARLTMRNEKGEVRSVTKHIKVGRS